MRCYTLHAASILYSLPSCYSLFSTAVSHILQLEADGACPGLCRGHSTVLILENIWDQLWFHYCLSGAPYAEAQSYLEWSSACEAVVCGGAVVYCVGHSAASWSGFGAQQACVKTYQSLTSFPCIACLWLFDYFHRSCRVWVVCLRLCSLDVCACIIARVYPSEYMTCGFFSFHFHFVLSVCVF